MINTVYVPETKLCKSTHSYMTCNKISVHEYREEIRVIMDYKDALNHVC